MGSQSLTKDAITALDPVNQKTYEGETQFLFDWFKDTVAGRLPNTPDKEQEQFNLINLLYFIK